jgi:hypothetical protein
VNKLVWSPLGTAPVQTSRLHRDQRYLMLPTCSQDGIVLSRVFQGSTDESTVFEDFIEETLQHCGRWLEPKTVLMMDTVVIDAVSVACSKI